MRGRQHHDERGDSKNKKSHAEGQDRDEVTHHELKGMRRETERQRMLERVCEERERGCYKCPEMLTQRKSIFSPLSSPCLTSNRAVQSEVGPLNHFNITLRFHSKVLLLTTDKRDVQSYVQEDEEQG